MRKLICGMVLMSLLLLAGPVRSEVLSAVEKEVHAVHIVSAPQPFPAELGYVITNFRPGNINFLERVDIVVDKEGRIQGIKIVYTPPDGFRRQIYLAGNRSIVIQEASPTSTLKKKVLFRVITTDELNKLD